MNRQTLKARRALFKLERKAEEAVRAAQNAAPGRKIRAQVLALLARTEALRQGPRAR